MQPGRWNETATQVIRTRIRINGVDYRGSARVDSQCYEGHPAKAGTSPAATCTLSLFPPSRTTTSVPPNPVIAIFFPTAAWPPNVGQSVTVDVGDGTRWWRVFTGRVDEIQGALSDGKVQVECVDESVRLDLRAQLPALHYSVAHDAATASGSGLASTAAFDLQGQTLADHAARAAGFHSHLEPAWDATMYLPMVGSAHPLIGSIYFAKDKINPANYNRPSWPDGDDGWQIGDKLLNVRFTPSPSPVEVTMDLPRRISGSGWSILTLRGATNSLGIRSGPFIAYDHDQDVIRYGFRTSRPNSIDVQPVPTASVDIQGTPIPRGAATRVTLRFTPRNPSATQHRFDVRTNTGATVNVPLTHSTGSIEAGWTAETLEYFGAGPMGAVQVVGAPETSFAQLSQTRSARIRHADAGWLVASRDIDLQARTILERLATAECGAFWVDRNAHLQYAGPLVRETQPIAATLTTELDIDNWAWTHNFEQRAKRVRINSLDCATWPSKTNTLLWTNQSGAETLAPGDLWEQIVNAEEDEDWLFVDTSSVQMYSDKGRSTLIGSTTHGGTLTDDQGGEIWEAFQVSWSLAQLGPRAVKWSAQASNTMPANQSVDLRIPTNATNVPQWWRGRALPRLLGSRIKWVEKSESVRTSATTGDEEYEHDADWYVQSTARLQDLRSYLQAQLGGRLPILDTVPVRADPRIDVGDRVTLLDEIRSNVQLDCVVLAVTGDWEDGKGATNLKVRVISAYMTDWDAVFAALNPPAPHWLQNQPSWERAT